MKLTVSKNDAPGGNEGLTLKAQWTLPGGWPAIDLLQNGLKRSLPRRRRSHPAAPPPLRAAVGKGPGWKVKTAGTKWSYKARTKRPAAGSTRPR